LRAAHRQALHGFAQENFYGFYRLMAPVLLPGETFSGARHFRALAHMLERAAEGTIRRLLIAIPPRHGKSLLASVALPAWILGRDPTRKIICASYGDLLAKDFSTRTRDLLRSPNYSAVFPDVELDAGGASTVELRTTAKGYRLATTVQGAVTGKGAHFIIIDDPLKAVEAESETLRHDVYEWTKGSLMTRFDNPAEGAMIVIHQRLHQDDLIGRLRADGGWEYLEMPGECLEPRQFDIGGGEIWNFRSGDLLYPERFDRVALDQLRFDLGEAQFNAQILQRPAPPGGNLFRLKHFQRYETAPQQFEAIVQSWDPAMTDSETSAYTVCTTWGILGRRLFLIDVFRKRLDYPQIEPAIVSMRMKYNATAIVVESSGVGRAIASSLDRRKDMRRGRDLFWINPRLGKLERAMAQTPKIERRRVYLPVSAPWLEAFEAELATFPLSKYCDQVDSMVHFFTFLDDRNRVTRNLSATKDCREQPF